VVIQNVKSNFLEYIYSSARSLIFFHSKPCSDRGRPRARAIASGRPTGSVSNDRAAPKRTSSWSSSSSQQVKQCKGSNIYRHDHTSYVLPSSYVASGGLEYLCEGRYPLTFSISSPSPPLSSRNSSSRQPSDVTTSIVFEHNTPFAPSCSQRTGLRRPRARPTSRAFAAMETKENRNIAVKNCIPQAVDVPRSSVSDHKLQNRKKKHPRECPRLSDNESCRPELSEGNHCTVLGDVSGTTLLSLEAGILAGAPSQLPAYFANAALCPFCDEALPSKPSPYLDGLLKNLRSHPNVRKRNGSYNPDALWLPSIESVVACRRHQEECEVIPNGLERGWPKEDEVDWDQLPT
jgi:hypothetical protein